MNRREARRKALLVAYHRVVSAIEDGRELAASDADDAAIRRELDRIAQRLYEQHLELTGSDAPQPRSASARDTLARMPVLRDPAVSEVVAGIEARDAEGSDAPTAPPQAQEE